MYLIFVKKTKKAAQTVFGKNIDARRLALGFESLPDFAEYADIIYETLRDIVYGDSQGTPATKKKLAKALQCSISDLYLDNNKPYTDPITGVEIKSAIDIAVTADIITRLHNLDLDMKRLALAIIYQDSSLALSVAIDSSWLPLFEGLCVKLKK